MMNTEKASQNMIQQQIRAGGVLSPQVIEAFYAVRRDEFVPETYKALAFADLEIPLSPDASMLRPRTEALLLEALLPKSTDRILEIGTGSGYMAALLGQLGLQVRTIEIDPDLVAQARFNLRSFDMRHIEVIQGDGAQGWGEENMAYDVILISGALSALPERFLDMLNVGGRLLYFLGRSPLNQAMLTTRLTHADYNTRTLFELAMPSLKEGVISSIFDL